MNTETLPILYSFRRCPYAMRARLAISESKTPLALREIVLRNKPRHMLEVSPKGTVPVLILPDGTLLEQSLDIMHWALGRNDPGGLYNQEAPTFADMQALIEVLDGPFKTALDRYKYPNRYEGVCATQEREKGAGFIASLEERLVASTYLFGERFSFADAAILPFIRQFAHVDRDWFWAQDWPNVINWLDEFLRSDRFAKIMKKHKPWLDTQETIIFGLD